jgi:hypothetical protein
MKLSLALFGALVCAGLNAQQGVTPPHTHLKVGDMAPDFTLPSTAGGTLPCRLPWQVQCGAGLLSRGLHRWLNEGNAGVPGWYRQI